MPKGYIVGRISVSDPDAYKSYAAAASEAVKLYGGRFLARGGRSEALEGEARPRNVVIEFESYDAAKRYYHSGEYQAAIELRKLISDAQMVVVEGMDPA